MNPSVRPPVPPALDCWYLTGATAAGKSKVGVELALRLGAEIISLDSMALYQGMDIGTAKPTASDRLRVPHHLLDLVPPTEEFSLSEYIDAAHAAIADIKSRSHEVLFVGGTPLYLKSLLRGVYQGPPADWNFRQEIERELQTLPLNALHQRLQVIDPLLAAKLHPNDKRRIIRGLEVFKTTGERLSHLQTQFDEGRAASDVKVFALSWPRDQLHLRIDARVEQMFVTGLVAEVRQLLATYGSLSRTAMQAVGYREVSEYLSEQETGDRGQETAVRWDERSARPLSSVPNSEFRIQNPESDSGHSALRTSHSTLSACIARVKARTRQFARRQETWFRALTECTFIPMHSDTAPADVARAVLEAAVAR